MNNISKFRQIFIYMIVIPSLIVMTAFFISLNDKVKEIKKITKERDQSLMILDDIK
jgi:hypothetical protein